MRTVRFSGWKGGAKIMLGYESEDPMRLVLNTVDGNGGCYHLL